MAALREDDNKVHAMIDSIKSEPASLVVMCCSPAIAIQTESKLLPSLLNNHPAQVRPAARRAPRDHRGALAAPVDTRRIRPPPRPLCAQLCRG